MLGVKKLVQEFEDSSKPAYFFGHMFGGVGVIAGCVAKYFCIPLFINLQDGVSKIRAWDSNLTAPGSHVIQMVENGFHATEILGDCIFLLDRYFLSADAFKRLSQLHRKHPERRLHLVTRAKRNCKAWYRPKPKSGRGRSPLKGEPIKLMELFESRADEFQAADIMLYGKKEAIRYLSVCLLWGAGIYQELKFVLVELNGRRAIFVTTDTGLPATDVLVLYGFRFSIENLFRTMKQSIGGFSYHFWSVSMPKLNRYKRKGEPDVLERV